MKKKHLILIVDDSPTVRRLVTLSLSQGGYDVITAENGEIGFETAQREKPAAILVDFVMPKMNGFEFCKKVRSDPQLANIPIVLITSKGKEVGKGFEENFGVSHYLQKPFDPKMLMTILREILPNSISEPRNGSASIEAQSPPAAPHAPAAEEKISPTVNADAGGADHVWEHISKELTSLLKRAVMQTLKETDPVRSSERVLSGDIRYISLENVIKLAGMAGMSGRLSVLTDMFSSEVYLEEGQIAFASITRSGSSSSLETMLCKDGSRQQEETVSCLAEAKGSSLRAGSLLVERGLLSEEELYDYFGRLTDDAMNETLSASSGHFSLEDLPLPQILRKMRLAKKAV